MWSIGTGVTGAARSFWTSASGCILSLLIPCQKRGRDVGIELKVEMELLTCVIDNAGEAEGRAGNARKLCILAARSVNRNGYDCSRSCFSSSNVPIEEILNPSNKSCCSASISSFVLVGSFFSLLLKLQHIVKYIFRSLESSTGPRQAFFEEFVCDPLKRLFPGSARTPATEEYGSC